MNRANRLLEWKIIKFEELLAIQYVTNDIVSYSVDI
jgi:hypothetical protein